MRILIYGITGQDGYYLTKQLLDEGHEVYGVARRVSTTNTQRLESLKGHSSLKIIEGDINDSQSRRNIIRELKPDRLYNLAAQSHVGTSFKQPELTLQTTGVSAILLMNDYFEICPEGRFYQASSSEMYGDKFSVNAELVEPKIEAITKLTDILSCEKLDFVWNFDEVKYQDEDTEFNPQSPYAIAKLSAHHHARCLRDNGYFCCAGILFNHESSLRGDYFVTKKITKYINDLESGKTEDKLRLGNINASRDWGFAGDYTKAMTMIIEHDKADEFVISTGETHTVKDFLSVAFEYVGKQWGEYVCIDQKFFRPNEVPFLRGISVKAREELGWKPEVEFKELVEKMIRNEV